MEAKRNLRLNTGGSFSLGRALLKITASVLVFTMSAWTAEAMTLPQLEYRLKFAEQDAENLRERLDEAQDRLEDLQDDLEDLQDERNGFQNQQKKLDGELAKADAQETEDLNRRKALVVAELKALDAKVAVLGKQIKDAIQLKARLQTRLTKAEQGIGNTRKELDGARRNTPVILAERKLELAEDDCERAEEALEKMDDAVEGTAQKCGSAAKRLERLQENLKEAQKDWAEAEARLKAAAPGDRAKADADLKRAKAEVALVRDQIRNVTAAKAKLEQLAKQAVAGRDAARQACKQAQDKVTAARNDVKAAKVTMKNDRLMAEQEAEKEGLARRKAGQEQKAKEQARAAAEENARKDLEQKNPATAPPTAPVETVHTEPWIPAPERELPVLQGDKRIQVPQAQEARIAAENAALPQFDVTMVSGDRDVVEKLQVWKDWSAFVVFNKVTPKQINEFHGQLLKALREEGYVFAQVTFPTRIWSTGIFLAKVDLGVLGNITVKNQKYYSARQIAGALRNKEGRFNYAKVHSDLFDLNVKPDLKLNTQLTTAMINGRRVINADIDVNDKLPIHGAIEITNTGSKDSDSDWRIRATLQHLNLTQNGDSLTLDYLTGGDVADNLNAFSASYFLPVDDQNHFNVYAGYNANYADDVLPEIAVRGKGFFGGFAWTHTLYENVRERVELSLGWYYHRNEEHIDLTGDKLDNEDMVVSMPTLTLGYSSKIYDRWNGRNFASISLKQNRAGTFGASSKEDFIQASATDGDFFIASLSAARFQRLFAGEDHPGKWTLYAKANAQMASDDLPSIMRDYLGGQNSVRGYEESELGGDNSFVGSLELRTPLLENFIPGLKKSDEKFFERHPEHWSMHRLQFVAFTDFGFVSEKHKENGEDDQGFWSVGTGIRLGLTKYAQMSLDYGLPLIDASEQTPEAGRFHFSLQLQF